MKNNCMALSIVFKSKKDHIWAADIFGDIMYCSLNVWSLEGDREKRLALEFVTKRLHFLLN
jgi:hypothetical protein